MKFLDFEEFRERKEKFREEFKVEAKVFDEKTLYVLYKLLAKGKIKKIKFPVKEGKESVVLAGLDKDGWIAIKVYRIYHCDFKHMWKYLIADPRFFSVKKNRRQVILTWVRREFKNMKIAFKAGVRCPEPKTFMENVLVMKFIGDDGLPAPRLVDIVPPNPQKVYEMITEDMKKMAESNLIHGDLSEYNILLWKNLPFIIDFSQGVRRNHPLATDFLRKDVENVNKYFKKLEVKINESLFDELKQILRL